jgi:hypothetical protein
VDWEDLRGSSIVLVGERACSSGRSPTSSVTEGGGGGDRGGGGPSATEGALMDVSSSRTVDWRFVLFSSSSSSAISIKRRLRSELVDEEVDPEAVWREQAAESSGSRSSFGLEIGKMVSWGEKRSVTALK